MLQEWERPLTTLEKARIMKELLREIALYPPTFFKNLSQQEVRVVFSPLGDTIFEKITLPRIMLSLGYNSGHGCGSRVDIGIYRYFDDGEDIFPAFTFHHELAHRQMMLLHDEGTARPLPLVEEGTLLSSRENTFLQDWREMHYAYGGGAYKDDGREELLSYGGIDMQQPPLVREKKIKELQESLRGFFPQDEVGAYGKTSPAEDYAHIFAAMISQGKQLRELLKKDPLLREKVRIVQEDSFAVSDGIMNEEYWNLLWSGDRKKLLRYLRLREQEAASGRGVGEASFHSKKRRIGGERDSEEGSPIP